MKKSSKNLKKPIDNFKTRCYNEYKFKGIEPNDNIIEIIEQEMVRFARFLQVSNSQNNIKMLGV